MRKSWYMRRRTWIAALVLLVVLAACVAQTPSATAPTAESPTATPASADSAPTESAATAGTSETTATVDSAVEVTPTVDATAAQTTTESAPAEEGSTAAASDSGASVSASSSGATESGGGTESEVTESSEVSPTEEVTATEETSPTSAIDLIGGAPLPSTGSYKGLPVGFTEEGFAYRGNPDAPIVMVEYSDFQCPFCNRYFIQTEPAVDESYVRTDQVRVVFHDFPLASLHPNAPAAHEASLCVADQKSAELYWNYHAALFRSVDEWQGLADPLPVFERLAQDAGADLSAYQACMASHKMQIVVQDRVNQAFARGFSATPSFQMVRPADNTIFQLIGAQPYEQFAGVVDSALAGEMPSVAQSPQQPEQQQPEGIPFWATAEGWQPDPDRPGFNMAGDEYRGDINAPVTVIEFSDFQCPFCKRHHDETQPALDEKYVDSGKVLWVYKNFPLNIHPQAPAAAVAGECAADQGKFWEMNDALFGNVDKWAIDDPTEIFKSLASEVGLDVDAFTACLADPAITERVNSDESEGAQYVQGTPTFIIIHGSEGSIIPGALPEASFSKVLDEQLTAAGASN